VAGRNLGYETRTRFSIELQPSSVQETRRGRGREGERKVRWKELSLAERNGALPRERKREKEREGRTSEGEREREKERKRGVRTNRNVLFTRLETAL